MPNVMFCVLHTIINNNGERQTRLITEVWSAVVIKATEEIKSRERRKIKEGVVRHFK